MNKGAVVSGLRIMVGMVVGCVLKIEDLGWWCRRELDMRIGQVVCYCYGEK